MTYLTPGNVERRRYLQGWGCYRRNREVQRVRLLLGREGRGEAWG